jgi:glucosamine--fructose-6-phosphate aminotransferase (isomerizing)
MRQTTERTNGSVNAEGVEIQRDAILARMTEEIELAGAAGRTAWPSIRAAASSIPSKPYRAIILTGCGDSYYAALALRHLLEVAADVPVLASPAMEAVTYPGRLADRDALLVAISVSGKVERTIQAAREHRQRGGTTVAISAHSDSDLGATANAAIATGIRGTPGPVPGTANFLGSILSLVAIAAELGVRTHGSGYREPDVEVAMDAIEELVSTGSALAHEEARVLTPPFFSLGSGPDLGVAWFGVAKFIEAAATVGVAQDLEEWAHEQYFTTKPGTSVFVHASSDLVRDRARRVAASVLKVGARLVTISPEPLGLADEHHWPIPPVPDELRPLVTWVPVTMTALAYAQVANRYPFGIDLASRMQTVDEDIYLAHPSRA